jgi:ABC-type lipoprotein export system ATPase subunit
MLANLFSGRHARNIPVIEPGTNGHRPIIQLRDLVKTYSNAAGDFTVLKDIDANFYEGEFVGVIGKSGSGKSTLLNMITGIDRPTAGEVVVGEVPVHELGEGRMAEWRGRNLGIVFQFFQLLPMLSLVENVMLPMDFCDMYTPRKRRERAMALLDRVGLADHAHKLPSAISGGQQQRVAIARALANDPPIVLADEPTGNLDSKTSENVFQLFEELVAQGKTIVMVTHDDSQAQRVSRTLLLVDGEIVNEYVARALPSLSDHQLLKATRQLESERFEPGAAIVQQDQIGDAFYIVTQGRVEVALKRPDASDVVVTRMGPGEYFGEIELLRGGRNIATVRATSEAPVEVVSLDREAFTDLLAESDETREAVAQIVEARLAEHRAAEEQTV